MKNQSVYLHQKILEITNNFDIITLSIVYRTSVPLIFLVFIFVSLFFYFENQLPKSKIWKFIQSEYLYIITIFAVLVLSRWPGLLPHRLNPDEYHFTASATKLLKDPVFWRSVDTATSGPLNTYILTFPAFFGLRLDSVTSRCIGLILVFIALLGLYYSLRSLYNQRIARLSLFPVATTFALMRAPDYIHYSSEHLSIAILSLALLIICYSYHRGFSYKNIFLLGFLLGLIPYAKLQGIPIVLVLSAFFGHVFWLKKTDLKVLIKGLSIFLVASLLPTFGVILTMVYFSSFEDFWNSYIVQNIFYTGNFKKDQASFLEKLLIIFPKWWMNLRDTRYLFALFQVMGLGLIFLAYKYKKKLFSIEILTSDTFVLTGYSLLMVAGSILAIIKPGTFFGHYLLFLIIPCGFAIGVISGEVEKAIEIPPRSRMVQSIFTVALIALLMGIPTKLIYSTIRHHNQYIWNQRAYLAELPDPISKTILKYASPEDTMAVWGWAAELYVNTGLVQATRDSVSLWQIKPSDLQPYYIRRFLNDMANSKAQLFVDAVSPSMFGFKALAKQRYETFPEVKKFVQENYQFVDEVQGVRIYTRK